MTLAEGMTGMMEGVFINVKNRSKTITAEVDVPAGGGERHHPCARRPLRRLGPVCQGRRTGLRLQLPGNEEHADHGDQAIGARQGDHPLRLRL